MITPLAFWICADEGPRGVREGCSGLRRMMSVGVMEKLETKTNLDHSSHWGGERGLLTTGRHEGYAKNSHCKVGTYQL